MLRLIFAVALVVATVTPTFAQMRCYMLNGRQVCCFVVGEQIVCQ